MDIIEIKNLSFVYSGENKKAINNLNLKIKKGQFIVLFGKSGSGKSTLLKLLKPEIAPYGEKKGFIKFNGTNIDEISDRTSAEKIGFVFQNPESQIITDKVWHELAFGLENLGVGTNEIRLRIAEIISFFGISDLFEKETSNLSGGQKQLLNLASVMAVNPEVLILDEPISQLNPIAAGDFMNMLKKINAEFGTTIILSEHRLEDVVNLCDKMVALENGTILCETGKRDIGENLLKKGSEMIYSMPAPIYISCKYKSALKCPVTVGEGRIWLENEMKEKGGHIKINKEDNTINKNEYAVYTKNVYFRYERKNKDILKELSIFVEKGTIYALLGENGAGKSTLANVISGVLKPYCGKINLNGSICMLPQNPMNVFSKNNVLDELKEITDNKEEIENICTLFDLNDFLYSHPYDLSGGQQQKTAIAKAFLTDKDIFILDEPTKCMDAFFKKKLGNIFNKLKERGKTIIILSHDMEFCAEYADRCGLIFNGSIIAEESSNIFFSMNNFYTTAVSRMSRGIIDGATVCDDVISVLEGKNKNISSADKENKANIKKPLNFNKKNMKKSKDYKDKNIYKKTGLNITMFLLFIMSIITILAGVYLFDDRKYYFISFFILLYTCIPFIFVFSNEKGCIRKIVTLAVMCSVCIAGRGAFYMLPHFKPMAAVIIVSGICFGASAGFLTGAFSAFISNFFFGQGPWTPWQMFAFGLIGFFAGIVFKNNNFKNKWSICAFGLVSVFILYGPIMNLSGCISVNGGGFSLAKLVVSFSAGFWFDFIHAVSTALFLFIGAPQLIQKIERLKLKYDIKFF